MEKRVLYFAAFSVLLAAAVVMFQRYLLTDFSEIPPAEKAERKAKIAKKYRYYLDAAAEDIERTKRYIEWAKRNIERDAGALKRAREALKGAEMGFTASLYRLFLEDDQAGAPPMTDTAAELLTGPAEELTAAAEKQLAAAEKLLAAAEKLKPAAEVLRGAWILSKDVYLNGDSWTDDPDEVRRAEEAQKAAYDNYNRADDAYSRAEDDYSCADDIYDAAAKVADAERLLQWAEGWEEAESVEAAHRLIAFNRERLKIARSGQEETLDEQIQAVQKAYDLERAVWKPLEPR